MLDWFYNQMIISKEHLVMAGADKPGSGERALRQTPWDFQ